MGMRVYHIQNISTNVRFRNCFIIERILKILRKVQIIKPPKSVKLMTGRPVAHIFYIDQHSNIYHGHRISQPQSTFLYFKINLKLKDRQ